jgi:hypothetical protein
MTGIIGSVIVAPLGARAQQEASKVARIAFLGPTNAVAFERRLEGLRAGLKDLGYTEGKNIIIEYRWAEGKYERLPELALELVRLKVDVLVVQGVPPTLAAKRATTTIPIVMASVGDAVATGLVTSLARPGGNITGVTNFINEVMAKRVELLKEAVPRTRRVAVLLNSDNPVNNAPIVETMGLTTKSLNIELHQFGVRAPADFDGALGGHRSRGPGIECWLESHRGSCGEAPSGFDRAPRVRGRGRPDRLRCEPSRIFSPRGLLRGQDPQGSETWRFAGRACTKLRARYQSEDREGARSNDPAISARSSGRRDPMIVGLTSKPQALGA